MAERHELLVPRTARYFVAPPQDGDVHEIWFLLHGYGQLAERFLGRCDALAGPGRLLVAPEGLSRFYLEGPRQRVGASWMTREERLAEIEDTLRFLTAVHEQVLAACRTGSNRAPRVNVLGFSQGAAAACRWAARGPARFEHAIAWAGGFPPELDPARWPADTALTLVAGDEDPWVEKEHIEAEVARLEGAGLAFRGVRFAGGHELDAQVLRELVRAS